MSNHSLEDVKEAFGASFAQYCQRHEIFPKKNKCGAFMVSDTRVLKQCLDVLDEHKNDVRNQLKGMNKGLNTSRTSSAHLNQQRPSIHNESTRRKQQKSSKKMKSNSTYINSYINTLYLDVILRDTSSIVPSHNVFSMSNDYILNTAASGREIYEFIINKTMEDIIITDYGATISLISPLLEQLQKAHKKFHYFSVLKHMVQKKESDQKLRCKYEVPKKKLREFFNLVLHKVMPKHLFGKLGNIKILKKTLFNFLDARPSNAFDLKPFITKLDISSIAWLKPVTNRKSKWLILAKFVKWFFNGFVIKIIRTQFHITSLSFNERVYIRRSDWCNTQKKFIKKKVSTEALQLDVNIREWHPPVGIYKLIPKRSDVRPIFISTYEGAEREDIKIVFTFLKQLYISKCGSTTFHEQWKSIIQKKCSSNNNKFYLVSSDVMDAFGSIVQGSLYDIIRSYCENLPEVLPLQYYGLKSRDKDHKYSDGISYRQYFIEPNLLLPVAPGKLYARVNHTGCQLIRKDWILQKIWKYIAHQRVKVRNKVYIVGKGVVQGMMLSPILADIYFNFIFAKQMSIFMNFGVMIRYMDDILYVTETEESAKQFYEMVQKGIPQYNCRFKQLKTQSNMTLNGGVSASRSIKFIGYKINCNTLEIVPEFSNTSIHYCVPFVLREKMPPFIYFYKKMYHLSSLKLSKLVLDATINVEATIITIIEKACLRQVRRFTTLISVLFNNHEIREKRCSILRIIRSSNTKFVAHVIRCFLANGQILDASDMWAWKRRILCMLRTSYENEFERHTVLRRNFKKILFRRKRCQSMSIK